MTREVRQLKLRGWVCLPLCWGFGYDSISVNYKVIIGAPKGENSCFRVMSLKSGGWSVAREVKYAFIRKDGVLCNGALHWIVKDENMKDVTASFDLSKEEFIDLVLYFPMLMGGKSEQPPLGATLLCYSAMPQSRELLVPTDTLIQINSAHKSITQLCFSIPACRQNAVGDCPIFMNHGF